MPSGRPRASDTAGRASPTFVRSGNLFFGAKRSSWVSRLFRTGIGMLPKKCQLGPAALLTDLIFRKISQNFPKFF